MQLAALAAAAAVGEGRKRDRQAFISRLNRHRAVAAAAGDLAATSNDAPVEDGAARGDRRRKDALLAQSGDSIGDGGRQER